MIKKYNIFKNLGKITTPYGGSTKDEGNHPGVDFANASGTPIPAFAGGTITGVGSKQDGTGNVVILKDNNGNTHQYSHLQSANVKLGDTVEKGEQIAEMGKSGNSYSPSGGDPSHLDIRIVSAYGKFKNPLTYVRNLNKTMV